MRFQHQKSQQAILLGDEFQLGVGGEARIFVLPEDPSKVVKIWHQPTAERARKVEAMLANPPIDPMAAQGHASIAWPLELVTTVSASPTVAGFIMPRVVEMHPIIDYFNPKTRLQRSPLFNYFYLVRTARNLATALRALHERGYVVGDLNECNILASETALVTLVDTDSFQVWDAAQAVLYRCRVGRPEFTPPELQGKSFASINREPVHDHFGLGTIVFQLLMEGSHPFAGRYRGAGEAPPYPERIGAGHFPHAEDSHVPYAAPPGAPHFEWLHPVAQHLIMRCFWEGHFDPSLRPDTLSWQYGLEEMEQNLVSCLVNPQHVYGNHLSACPWCERTVLLGGRDPFPSFAAVQAGEHLLPPPQRPAGAWGPAVDPPVPARLPSPTMHPSGGKASRRPIPSPRADRIKAAFGGSRRNEWAWIALGCGVIAVLLARTTLQPLLAVASYAAILLGIAGEMKAREWSCDGRGQWPARIGMTLGIIANVLPGLTRAF